MCGKYSPVEVKKFVEEKIVSDSNFLLEYVAVVDAQTLRPISKWDNHTEIVICIAVILGKVRLIDNVLSVPLIAG